MKEFRTLDLAVEFYKKTESLKLAGNLRDQLSRAASSISLNLGEGNAKRTEKEKNLLKSEIPVLKFVDS